MALMVMSSFVWDNPWLYEGGILPTPDVVPTVRISRPAVQSYGEMAQMKGKLQPMETGEVRSYPPLEGQG
jgi:hypothetical protein